MEADSPPYDAMVRAYAARLALADGRQIAREQVDPALAWAGLRSWLVAWSNYLGTLTTARFVQVLGWIDTLVRWLELEAHR